MKPMSLILRITLAILGPSLVLGYACPGRAQLSGLNSQTNVPVPGAGHDYLHILNDTVDPGSGNLSVHIDIPLPPGRGLSLPFSINYNSSDVFNIGEQTWEGGITGGPAWVINGGGGWSTSFPTLSASSLDMFDPPSRNLPKSGIPHPQDPI